jgi:ureidoglycolate dehydrogenase (NAD+)
MAQSDALEKSLQMEYFKTPDLRKLGVASLAKTGVSKKSAELVVDSLITTSLRGVESHGIRLLPHYLQVIRLGRVNPKPNMTFVKTMAATGRLHADNSLGIVSGMEAMSRAISMAKKVGMGSVAVSHSSHFGAAGLYTIEAAKQGMIGFACTHVEALVLPYNGKKPFLGTNAISYAFPCAEEDPVCLDMATTTMSLNKLNMYKNSNTPIPDGWAADAEGTITTNPKRAQFLTHFGGYKGYGFAFVVDAFSSLLSGMPFGPHLTPMFPLNSTHRNLGHFFSVINIEAFEKLPIFKKRISQMVRELRSIPSVSTTPVMVPGDPEKKIFKERSAAGKIPIPRADLSALLTVAKTLRVDHTLYKAFE